MSSQHLNRRRSTKEERKLCGYQNEDALSEVGNSCNSRNKNKKSAKIRNFILKNGTCDHW